MSEVGVLPQKAGPEECGEATECGQDATRTH